MHTTSHSWSSSNKHEWQKGTNPDNWYTDKSKTNTGTGDGDYRWGLRRGTASVLGSTPWYSSLKYMPLTSVNVVNGYTGRNNYVLFYSLAAIKVLDSFQLSSKLGETTIISW
jgi:hypothetical protein